MTEGIREGAYRAMKSFSAVIRVLSWVAYAMILVTLLISLPIVWGNRPIVILSGSMESAYPVGSITYYRPVEFWEYSMGDAVTFETDGEDMLATHRIITINHADRSFVTKGDANDNVDPEPLSFANVKGLTWSFAIPFAGYFISFVQKWYVIAVLGLILICDLILIDRGDGQEKKAEKPVLGRSPDDGEETEKTIKPRNAVKAEKRIRPQKAENTEKSNKSPKKGKSTSRGITAEDFFRDF